LIEVSGNEKMLLDKEVFERGTARRRATVRLHIAYMYYVYEEEL